MEIYWLKSLLLYNVFIIIIIYNLSRAAKGLKIALYTLHIYFSLISKSIIIILLFLFPKKSIRSEKIY